MASRRYFRARPPAAASVHHYPPATASGRRDACGAPGACAVALLAGLRCAARTTYGDVLSYIILICFFLPCHRHGGEKHGEGKRLTGIEISTQHFARRFCRVLPLREPATAAVRRAASAALKGQTFPVIHRKSRLNKPLTLL